MFLRGWEWGTLSRLKWVIFSTCPCHQVCLKWGIQNTGGHVPLSFCMLYLLSCQVRVYYRWFWSLLLCPCSVCEWHLSSTVSSLFSGVAQSGPTSAVLCGSRRSALVCQRRWNPSPRSPTSLWVEWPRSERAVSRLTSALKGQWVDWPALKGQSPADLSYGGALRLSQKWKWVSCFHCWKPDAYFCIYLWHWTKCWWLFLKGVKCIGQKVTEVVKELLDCEPGCIELLFTQLFSVKWLNLVLCFCTYIVELHL